MALGTRGAGSAGTRTEALSDGETSPLKSPPAGGDIPKHKRLLSAVQFLRNFPLAVAGNGDLVHRFERCKCLCCRLREPQWFGALRVNSAGFYEWRPHANGRRDLEVTQRSGSIVIEDGQTFLDVRI